MRDKPAPKGEKKSNAYFDFLLHTIYHKIISNHCIFNRKPYTNPIENTVIYQFSTAIYEFLKIKICVRFFRLWVRVCLAFHAQSEFLDEPKCVERGITHTFQRAAARLQTREPREMRTEKLTSVKLILGHSLIYSFVFFDDLFAMESCVFFPTRPKFSKRSISASIWSPEDFRTTVSTYFCTKIPFLSVSEAFANSSD